MVRIGIVGINANARGQDEHRRQKETYEAQEASLVESISAALRDRRESPGQAASLLEACLKDPLMASAASLPRLRDAQYAALICLGDIRLEEGAAADALRCYARALDLDGSSLSLWRKSTMAALHSANLPFARAAADGALRLGRSHLRTLEFVAEVLLSLGDLAGCAAVCRDVLAIAPHHARASSLHARLAGWFAASTGPPPPVPRARLPGMDASAALKAGLSALMPPAGEELPPVVEVAPGDDSWAALLAALAEAVATAPPGAAVRVAVAGRAPLLFCASRAVHARLCEEHARLQAARPAEATGNAAAAAEEPELPTIERERRIRIEENQRKLRELGLASMARALFQAATEGRSRRARGGSDVESGSEGGGAGEGEEDGVGRDGAQGLDGPLGQGGAGPAGASPVGSGREEGAGADRDGKAEERGRVASGAEVGSADGERERPERRGSGSAVVEGSGAQRGAGEGVDVEMSDRRSSGTASESGDGDGEDSDVVVLGPAEGGWKRGKGSVEARGVEEEGAIEGGRMEGAGAGEVESEGRVGAHGGGEGKRERVDEDMGGGEGDGERGREGEDMGDGEEGGVENDAGGEGAREGAGEDAGADEDATAQAAKAAPKRRRRKRGQVEAAGGDGAAVVLRRSGRMAGKCDYRALHDPGAAKAAARGREDQEGAWGVAGLGAQVGAGDAEAGGARRRGEEEEGVPAGRFVSARMAATLLGEDVLEWLVVGGEKKNAGVAGGGSGRRAAQRGEGGTAAVAGRGAAAVTDAEWAALEARQVGAPGAFGATRAVLEVVLERAEGAGTGLHGCGAAVLRMVEATGARPRGWRAALAMGEVALDQALASREAQRGAKGGRKGGRGGVDAAAEAQEQALLAEAGRWLGRAAGAMAERAAGGEGSEGLRGTWPRVLWALAMTAQQRGRFEEAESLLAMLQALPGDDAAAPGARPCALCAVLPAPTATAVRQAQQDVRFRGALGTFRALQSAHRHRDLLTALLPLLPLCFRPRHPTAETGPSPAPEAREEDVVLHAGSVSYVQALAAMADAVAALQGQTQGDASADGGNGGAALGGAWLARAGVAVRLTLLHACLTPPPGWQNPLSHLGQPGRKGLLPDYAQQHRTLIEVSATALAEAAARDGFAATAPQGPGAAHELRGLRARLAEVLCWMVHCARLQEERDRELVERERERVKEVEEDGAGQGQGQAGEDDGRAAVRAAARRRTQGHVAALAAGVVGVVGIEAAARDGDPGAAVAAAAAVLAECADVVDPTTAGGLLPAACLALCCEVLGAGGEAPGAARAETPQREGGGSGDEAGEAGVPEAGRGPSRAAPSSHREMAATLAAQVVDAVFGTALAARGGGGGASGSGAAATEAEGQELEWAPVPLSPARAAVLWGVAWRAWREGGGRGYPAAPRTVATLGDTESVRLAVAARRGLPGLLATLAERIAGGGAPADAVAAAANSEAVAGTRGAIASPAAAWALEASIRAGDPPAWMLRPAFAPTPPAEGGAPAPAAVSDGTGGPVVPETQPGSFDVPGTSEAQGAFDAPLPGEAAPAPLPSTLTAAASDPTRARLLSQLTHVLAVELARQLSAPASRESPTGPIDEVAVARFAEAADEVERVAMVAVAWSPGDVWGWTALSEVHLTAARKLHASLRESSDGLLAHAPDSCEGRPGQEGLRAAIARAEHHAAAAACAGAVAAVVQARGVAGDWAPGPASGGSGDRETTHPVQPSTPATEPPSKGSGEPGSTPETSPVRPPARRSRGAGDSGEGVAGGAQAGIDTPEEWRLPAGSAEYAWECLERFASHAYELCSRMVPWWQDLNRRAEERLGWLARAAQVWEALVGRPGWEKEWVVPYLLGRTRSKLGAEPRVVLETLAAAVAASAPLPRWPRALPFFRLHLTRLKLLGGPGGAEAAAQFRFSGTLDRREEQAKDVIMAIDFVRDLCPAFHPAALWLTKLAPTALEAPGINALDLLRTRAIPSTASAKQGRATAALDPLEPWWSAREAAAAEAEMGEGPAKPSRGVQGLEIWARQPLGIAPDPQLDWEMTLGGRFLWKNHVQSAKILRLYAEVRVAVSREEAPPEDLVRIAHLAMQDARTCKTTWDFAGGLMGALGQTAIFLMSEAARGAAQGPAAPCAAFALDLWRILFEPPPSRSPAAAWWPGPLPADAVPLWARAAADALCATAALAAKGAPQTALNAPARRAADWVAANLGPTAPLHDPAALAAALEPALATLTESLAFRGAGHLLAVARAASPASPPATLAAFLRDAPAADRVTPRAKRPAQARSRAGALWAVAWTAALGICYAARDVLRGLVTRGCAMGAGGDDEALPPGLLLSATRWAVDCADVFRRMRPVERQFVADAAAGASPELLATLASLGQPGVAFPEASTAVVPAALVAASVAVILFHSWPPRNDPAAAEALRELTASVDVSRLLNGPPPRPFAPPGKGADAKPWTPEEAFTAVRKAVLETANPKKAGGTGLEVARTVVRAAISTLLRGAGAAAAPVQGPAPARGRKRQPARQAEGTGAEEPGPAPRATKRGRGAGTRAAGAQAAPAPVPAAHSAAASAGVQIAPGVVVWPPPAGASAQPNAAGAVASYGYPGQAVSQAPQVVSWPPPAAVRLDPAALQRVEALLTYAHAHLTSAAGPAVDGLAGTYMALQEASRLIAQMGGPGASPELTRCALQMAQLGSAYVRARNDLREWLATEMGVSLQQAENELLQRKVGC